MQIIAFGELRVERIHQRPEFHLNERFFFSQGEHALPTKRLRLVVPHFAGAANPLIRPPVTLLSLSLTFSHFLSLFLHTLSMG